MVVGKFHRTVRRLAAWPLIAVSVVTAFPSATHAQVTLFNSNGFEPTTFSTGNIGAFYGGGGPTGQQGYLTTDFNQFLGGTPAGTIQTGTVLNGAQAFQINGSALFDDPTFSGQTFWYRNYPTAGTAFNPVNSGNALVRIAYDQRVSSVALNLNEMPLVGTYMEGYAQSDSSQHALGSVFFNQNGGITVITAGGPSGTPLSTAPGLYSHDAWHHFQVDFNFSTQRYRTFVDGNLVSFSGGVTDVPFRFNGLDRIAEYGFEGSFNEATTVTQNNAFFDNYSAIASPVPEPTSLILCGGAFVGAWAVRRRKRA